MTLPVCGTIFNEKDREAFERNVNHRADDDGRRLYCPITFHVLVKKSTDIITDEQLRGLVGNRLNPDFCATNDDIHKLDTLIGKYAKYSTSNLEEPLGNPNIEFYIPKGGIKRVALTDAEINSVVYAVDNSRELVNGDGDTTDLNDLLTNSRSPLVEKTVNIYITSMFRGLLGFASLGSNIMVVDWRVLGQYIHENIDYLNRNVNGRTVTHEMGHVFSLPHTFEFGETPNYNAKFIRDNVNPNMWHGAYCVYEHDMAIENPNYENCAPGWDRTVLKNYPTTTTTKLSNSDGVEMVMNYMDYCTDATMVMFTSEQAKVIRTQFLNNPDLYGDGAKPVLDDEETPPIINDTPPVVNDVETPPIVNDKDDDDTQTDYSLLIRICLIIICIMAVIILIRMFI